MTNTDSKDLDWVQLRKDMEAINPSQESRMDRFKRKFRESPLVPLGCLVTASILAYGLISFKRGNKQMQQYMMRARVISQGVTITIALISTVIAVNKLKAQKAENTIADELKK